MIISLSRTVEITESHEAKIKADIMRNKASFRIRLVYSDYAKMQGFPNAGELRTKRVHKTIPFAYGGVLPKLCVAIILRYSFRALRARTCRKLDLNAMRQI